MEITLTVKGGQLSGLEKLVVACQTLSVDQIRRLCRGTEASDVAERLGLGKHTTEKSAAESIYKHFNS